MGIELLGMEGISPLVLFVLIALPIVIVLLTWDYYRSRAQRRPHRRSRARPPEILPRRPRVVRRGGRRR